MVDAMMSIANSSGRGSPISQSHARWRVQRMLEEADMDMIANIFHNARIGEHLPEAGGPVPDTLSISEEEEEEEGEEEEEDEKTDAGTRLQNLANLPRQEQVMYLERLQWKHRSQWVKKQRRRREYTMRSAQSFRASLSHSWIESDDAVAERVAKQYHEAREKHPTCVPEARDVTPEPCAPPLLHTESGIEKRPKRSVRILEPNPRSAQKRIRSLSPGHNGYRLSLIHI